MGLESFNLIGCNNMIDECLLNGLEFIDFWLLLEYRIGVRVFFWLCNDWGLIWGLELFCWIKVFGFILVVFCEFVFLGCIFLIGNGGGWDFDCWKVLFLGFDIMDMVCLLMLVIKVGEGVSVDCEEVLLVCDFWDIFWFFLRFGLGGIGGGGGEIEYCEFFFFVLLNKFFFVGDVNGFCFGGEVKVWEELWRGDGGFLWGLLFCWWLVWLGVWKVCWGFSGLW